MEVKCERISAYHYHLRSGLNWWEISFEPSQASAGSHGLVRNSLADLLALKMLQPDARAGEMLLILEGNSTVVQHIKGMLRGRTRSA